MNTAKLREQLDAKGLSINQLAELSNVDKASISRLLRGGQTCTIETAQKIFEALKLTPKQASSIFFEGEVAKEQQTES